MFDDHDLVMTPTTAMPPPPADISTDAGALRSFNQGSPYVCYTPTWNYVGQPAASIPVGFDSDGLPMAIQLAAAPSNETTIISLAAQIEAAQIEAAQIEAAQIEAAQPWQDRRPQPISHQDVR